MKRGSCATRGFTKRAGLSARIVAQKLTESLGANFVVDNRPGAAGIVGTEAVAKSKPDGYALLVVSSSHAMNPAMYSKLPYDTARDFVPVSLLGTTPFFLGVSASLGVKSLAECCDSVHVAGYSTPPSVLAACTQ